MNDISNYVTGFITLLGTLGAVWIKSRFDRIGGKESTLANAEEKFREDMQATLDRQWARIKTLEEDQKANYAQITILTKKNAAMDREIEKKDEIIAELQQQVASLRAQVAKLETTIEQMQGGK